MNRIFDRFKKKENIILFAVVLLAALSRLAGLNKLPDGVLPDEAYGAYNAWALLKEGIDSRGYAFPVYFVAWGSGMNALYSYLAIPLFQLFGPDIVVYRIPQAVTGICAVYAAYVLGRELVNKKFGLFFAFVLAINPWHIMNSRFGLESNMAPGMLLIALCFCVLGLKRNGKYLIASAACFGATLYCYALSWIVVPCVLLLCIFLFWKRIPRNRYAVLFVLILFFMALPLFLFLAVNMGWLPEIKTMFFSVPKLPSMRGAELSAGNIFNSLKDLIRVVFTQYDGKAHTSSRITGSYYLFTTPFIVIGITGQLVSFVRNYKNGDNALEFIFAAWLFGDVVMCLLNQNITVIHINLIHIPVIFYGAYGIYHTACWFHSQRVIYACVLFFLFSFAIFFYDYAANPTTYFFDERTDEAIEAAKSYASKKTEDGIVTIVGYATIKYSYLLWHEKPSAGDYSANVVYTGDPAWTEMAVYGRFRYAGGTDEELSPVCIITKEYAERMLEKGFSVHLINDRYFLAVNEDALQSGLR